MESEFPANSRRAREEPTEPKKEKRHDKIIEGRVSRRKKPLGKRFGEMFVAGDSATVGQYLLTEVLLPAARDMITDAISQGAERLIYGEARPTSRRFGTPGGAYAVGQTNYSRYGSIKPRATAAPDPRPPMSRQARARHDFNEIVLDTRREAEDVLASMYDALERYDSVSVSDLYDMVGETPSFADEKWGWVNLHGSSVRNTRYGYLLDLPAPTPLD